MVAYDGGRAECRIRRCEVPVVLCDFTSMYPTVQTPDGLEPFLTCDPIDVIEVDAFWQNGSPLTATSLESPSTFGCCRGVERLGKSCILAADRQDEQRG